MPDFWDELSAWYATLDDPSMAIEPGWAQLYGERLESLGLMTGDCRQPVPSPYPGPVRSAHLVGIPFEGVWYRSERVDNGLFGQIGVNVTLGNNGYSPGHNHNDPFHDALVSNACGAYWRVYSWDRTGNDFPRGMLFYNESPSWRDSSQVVRHGWANSLHALHIEIWPKRPNGRGGYVTDENVSGARIGCGTFDNVVRSPSGLKFYESPGIGTIILPTGHDRVPDPHHPNLVKAFTLAGFIKENGADLPESESGRLKFWIESNTSYFGPGNNSHPYTCWSYFRNSARFYRSRPMWTGSYSIRIFDNATSRDARCSRFLGYDTGERIDLELSAPNFGLP